MIIPTLSAEAVRALARATLGGPDCFHEIEVRDLLTATEDYKLTDLAKYFHYGPDTFLATYAILNKRFNLGPDDIAQAYCIDHLPMVQVANKIFQERGFHDPYFDCMRERSFELTERNFGQYLFGCLGRIGKIKEITRIRKKSSRAKIDSEACYLHGWVPVALENVIVPAGVKGGQRVAIHFASGFSVASDEITEKIIREQSRTILPLHFNDPIRKIDFANIFGQDLASWTEEQLTPDNKED